MQEFVQESGAWILLILTTVSAISAAIAAIASGRQAHKTAQSIEVGLMIDREKEWSSDEMQIAVSVLVKFWR